MDGLKELSDIRRAVEFSARECEMPQVEGLIAGSMAHIDRLISVLNESTHTLTNVADRVFGPLPESDEPAGVTPGFTGQLYELNYRLGVLERCILENQTQAARLLSL